MSNINNRPANIESGLYHGARHNDPVTGVPLGGIKTVVDGVKTIEIEGGEFFICREAMASKEIFDFKNKTNLQILTKLFREEGCIFEQGKAREKDFITCRLVVNDPKPRDISGTPKQIINVLQSEKACKMSSDSTINKKGGAFKEITPEELEARWSKKRESIETLSNNIQKLRNNVSRDLKSENDKVMLTALAVAIMDKTFERVGNETSFKAGHVGVSGLKKNQVNVIGNKIHLDYIGKSGVQHTKSFSDERIAKYLKQAIKNSPTKRVFCTLDKFQIKADRINRYLTDFDISAKDIRGFGANYQMISKLKNQDIAEKESDRKKVYLKTLRSVAEKVGHGFPTLRKHYVIPQLELKYVNDGQIIDISDRATYEDGGGLDCGCKHEEGGELLNEIKIEAGLFDGKTIPFDKVEENIDEVHFIYVRGFKDKIEVEKYISNLPKSFNASWNMLGDNKYQPIPNTYYAQFTFETKTLNKVTSDKNESAINRRLKIIKKLKELHKIEKGIDFIPEENREEDKDLEIVDKNRNFTQKTTKDELQDVLSGTNQVVNGSLIQTTASYIRRSQKSSEESRRVYTERQEEKLVEFINNNNLWYSIPLGNYFARGVEQNVYLDASGEFVLKANTCFSYDYNWSKYLDSLLIHNYLFPQTSYELLGFSRSEKGSLVSIVKQHYVKDTSPTDIEDVEKFLSDKGFIRTHPSFNMYQNNELGVVLGDLHIGNVLTKDKILYFIDSVIFIIDDNGMFKNGGDLENGGFLSKNREKFQLPDNHEPFMQVPKGGSSCANCKWLAEDKKNCTNKYFIKWYGKSLLPQPVDEYCSDWFQPVIELKSGGELNKATLLKKLVGENPIVKDTPFTWNEEEFLYSETKYDEKSISDIIYETGLRKTYLGGTGIVEAKYSYRIVKDGAYKQRWILLSELVDKDNNVLLDLGAIGEYDFENLGILLSHRGNGVGRAFVKELIKINQIRPSIGYSNAGYNTIVSALKEIDNVNTTLEEGGELENKLEKVGSLNTYQKRVSENIKFMDSKFSDWRAVPIIGFENTNNHKGKEVPMPTFQFPVGYKNAISLFPISSDTANCELCGKTPIRTIYWLQNDSKKETLRVGSECVSYFGEGKSGKENLKESKIILAKLLDGDLSKLSSIINKRYRKVKDAGYGRKNVEWSGSFIGEWEGANESMIRIHNEIKALDPKLIFTDRQNKLVNGKDEINWKYVYDELPNFPDDFDLKQDATEAEIKKINTTLLSWFTRKEEKAVQMIKEVSAILTILKVEGIEDFNSDYLESKNKSLITDTLEEGGNINLSDYEISKIDIPIDEVINFINENGGVFELNNAIDFSNKWLGYDIVSYIDSGKNGVAYKLSNGHVLKITFSKKEAISSNSLVGKKLNFHADIYNVKQLRDEPLYIIEKEYLDEIPENEKLLFFTMLQILQEAKRKDLNFEDVLKSHNKHFTGNEYESSEDQNSILQLYNHLKQIEDEYISSTGDIADDINISNVGYKDNKVACFDCKYEEGGNLELSKKDNVMKQIDETNYFENTKSDFKVIAVGKDAESQMNSLAIGKEFYHISDSGSKYLIIDGIVYRLSDHWGNVGKNEWNFIGQPSLHKSLVLASCPLSEFTLKPKDNIYWGNVVEYITQKVFKGQKLKNVCRAFVKMFGGGTNPFLGQGILVFDVKEVEQKYYEDKARTSIKNKIKSSDEGGLDFMSNYFGLEKEKFKEEIKKIEPSENVTTLNNGGSINKSFSEDSIKKGIETELEHTETFQYVKDNTDVDIEDVALMIALDHLSENPNHYSEEGIVVIDNKVTEDIINKAKELEMEHKGTIKYLKEHPECSISDAARLTAIDHLNENPNYYDNEKFAKGGEILPDEIKSARRYKSSTKSDAYNFVKHQQEYSFEIVFNDGYRFYISAPDRASAIEEAKEERVYKLKRIAEINAPKKIWNLTFPEFMDSITLRSNSIGNHKQTEIILDFEIEGLDPFFNIKEVDTQDKNNEYLRLQLEKLHYNKVVEAIENNESVPFRVIEFYQSNDSLLQSNYGTVTLDRALEKKKEKEVSPELESNGINKELLNRFLKNN